MSSVPIHVGVVIFSKGDLYFYTDKLQNNFSLSQYKNHFSITPLLNGIPYNPEVRQNIK